MKNELAHLGTSVETRPVVLVVDDNPNNLLLMGELLDGPYRVRIAKSGAQALAAVASAPRPELVLLDIMMPGMDGHEVLRRLREDPATAQLPVIFVTANDAGVDEELGLREGAVDYISKPIKPNVVLARVATHLELSQARAALACRNADLEAEVARQVRHIQLVQEVCIHALASLGETRDNETGHHILRTQMYIDVLGRYLQKQPKFAEQLSPRRLELIVKASPLHDIGKIGIRDSILLKPGRLTAEEFEVMKTHASIGGQALERAVRRVSEHLGAEFALSQAGAGLAFGAGALDFLLVAREIAVGHHEKWDGTGYPDGLRGEAIALSARLMALADVFDALISRRVYKEPMPIDEVTRIIREGRGKHFDPDIVDAFFACLDDFCSIASRYADRDLATPTA